MTRTLAVLFFSLFLPLSSLAGEKTYHIRKQDSLFGFEILKWIVFKEEGRFRNFSGTITYDPLRPEQTSVDITIEVASVDSRDADRDQVIRSQDYFFASRFPHMTFRSKEVRRQGRDTLIVAGDITIRGVSRRIEVPIRVTGVHEGPSGLGSLVGFEGSFVIRRTDFNIAPQTSMLSNEVTIKLLVGASTRGA